MDAATPPAGRDDTAMIDAVTRTIRQAWYGRAMPEIPSDWGAAAEDDWARWCKVARAAVGVTAERIAAEQEQAETITRYVCSSRCWQKGGPHGEDCKPTTFYAEAPKIARAAGLSAGATTGGDDD